MTKSKTPALHIRQAFRNLKTTAALSPSSPFVAHRICKHVAFENAAVLVEYGAGNGAITRHLLRQMRPDTRLFLIEINPELVAKLQQRIRDPRVTIIQGSAVDAPRLLARYGVTRVDCVVSSIPFFWLQPDEREKVVRDTHQMLIPEGSFFTLQMFWLPQKNQYRYLSRYFEQYNCEIEYRNLPPLQLFRSVK